LRNGDGGGLYHRGYGFKVEGVQNGKKWKLPLTQFPKMLYSVQRQGLGWRKVATTNLHKIFITYSLKAHQARGWRMSGDVVGRLLPNIREADSCWLIYGAAH
jgi:hypothetical protein